MPDIQIPRDQLKLVAQKLGINQPIGSAKVVGDRIEIRLMGGGVLFWPPDAPSVNLAALTVSKLKQLAEDQGIAVTSKMKKADLIAALEER
jgi:hypothetical protein